MKLWVRVGGMDPIKDMVLDVRPMLAKGQEPFGAIMEARHRLLQGQNLLLIAPFEPRPLYEMLKAKGYSIRVQRVADGEWHIHVEAPVSLVEELSIQSPSGVPKELDLRSLEPREVQQKGLEEIGRLGRGETLVLHTQFRPVHFFEQVDAKAFDYDCEEIETHLWTTHIWRIGV